MLQGMVEDIILEKLLSPSEVNEGIKGLLDTMEVDGVFSYTFFKGTASVID